MDRSLEEFIAGTLSATSLDDVGSLLRRAFEDEGFAEFAFARFTNGVMTEVVWDTIRNGFIEAYREQRWDRVDPLVARARMTARAFTWQSLQPGASFSDAQQDFFAELRARGLYRGVMAPLHGPGGRLDLCSLISSGEEAAPPETLRRVHAIALQAWLRLSDFTPVLPAETAKLSRRELECLKWMREGKSNWDISQILSISEKTVEFHVGNVMRKLRADSRLAAVMLALRSGIVPL